MQNVFNTASPSISVNLEMPSPGCQGRRCVGFSLIEVTLALGIMTFAILSVIGVLPVGLSTLRDAMNDMTKAQIVQRIAGNAALSTFSDLRTHFDGGEFYFGEDGQQLHRSDSEVRYRVETRCEPPELSASAPDGLDQSLARIEMEIFRLVYGVGRSAGIYSLHVATDGR
jgi:uncharacterized protein (TIGR02598 family)